MECWCVVQKRDRLTRLKQARDALRMDNIKLRHQGGLVGHLDLLRDFEEQVDKVSVLGWARVGQLRRLCLYLWLNNMQ